MRKLSSRQAAVQTKDRVYLGLNGWVVALDLLTGVELWRTNLRAGKVMSLFVRGHRLIVGGNGHVWSVDVRNGGVHWMNELKGCGYGFVALATMDHPESTEGVAQSLLDEEERERRTGNTVH